MLTVILIVITISPMIFFSFRGFNRWVVYYSKNKNVWNYLRYLFLRYIKFESETEDTHLERLFISLFCLLWIAFWGSIILGNG